MIKKSRQRSGNMLIVMLVTAALIVVPLLLFLGQFGLHNIDRERTQSVVEAASLVAANEVSRLTIDDPHFGYVALSNFPAQGQRACTTSGEPLPVTGINTLVGTIRQNAIVARELNNETMQQLATFDRTQMQKTIKELNAAIKDALTQRPKGQYHDPAGIKVEPYKHVVSFLKTNLPPGVQLESIELASGWLEGGSTSATVAPQPIEKAQMKPNDSLSGQYRSFVILPVDGETYTFAGLGPTASLVRTAAFRKADATKINSIVRLECVISRKHTVTASAAGTRERVKIYLSACAQPYSMDDGNAGGMMTLRFTGVPAVGLRSWSDFLDRHTFRDRNVASYRAMSGDYPIDSGSRLVEVSADEDAGTSQQFAEHLYYWLRSGHVRPRLDAIVAMVNERFQISPGETIAYQFVRNGGISRTATRDLPTATVIADAQSQTVSDTETQLNNPIIVIRDNVSTLGATHGGKHGGQPLKGVAVDIEIGGTLPSTAIADVTRMRALKR